MDIVLLKAFIVIYIPRRWYVAVVDICAFNMDSVLRNNIKVYYTFRVSSNI